MLYNVCLKYCLQNTVGPIRHNFCGFGLGAEICEGLISWFSDDVMSSLL